MKWQKIEICNLTIKMTSTTKPFYSERRNFDQKMLRSTHYMTEFYKKYTLHYTKGDVLWYDNRAD